MTALESEILLQERKVTAAFKDLRDKKFEQNLPFLIFSEDLPEGQSYLDYPDGSMKLQEVFEEGSSLRSRCILTLNHAEAIAVRVKNGLF